MGDHSVAMSAAAAISAALFEREKSSKGQLVETSLIRQGAYTISFDLNALLMWGRTIALGSREGMGNPAMNNYKASCGKRFWLVGIEPFRHWPPLARAVGHPEWIEDERFSDPAARAKNAKELISKLDEIFATRTLDEWSEIFSSEPDLFWAPVNTPDDLLADQTFSGSGALLDVPDGSTGTLMISTPVDFHGTPATPRSLAPKLGEHTAEILREIGLSDEEIESMHTSGVVIDGSKP
jgi:crotonobetainyl-CoA:carnitine CoA-transferase CaiB-like acyl-CoA transferase